MSTIQVHEDLQQLIERLKPVKNFLGQNSYIKDTKNKLNRLMNDAQVTPTVLLIGKERVGKTTTINSFLGRNILASSTKSPTKVNTYLKYGESEYINAVFSDGVEITFDLNKLPLLTISDIDSAQIIREHIDYIEIYLQHPNLKNVTLIDSTAIESDSVGSGYFSHTMLDRADEILWLVRAGSPLTEAELDLLKKIVTTHLKPNIVVNAIDCYEGDVQDFIASEKQRYGQYVDRFIAVSALEAMEAAKVNDPQLLIDSNFTQFGQLIDSLSAQTTKKVEHMVERFANWLQLFILELQQLPNREPFASAAQSITQFNVEQQSGTSKEERDRVIIQAYREEYKEVSKVFEGVETLYLLLQKVAATFYLRDEEVELFEELAFAYQQNVRNYRKKHTEYTQTYSRVESQYKKTFNKYLQQWSTMHTNDSITSQVENLKKQYSELKDLSAIINHQKKTLLQNFYKTQNHLTQLAENRMQYILKQVSALNNKRKVELVYLKSYNEKMKEFKCIDLAERFLLDAVKPFLLTEMKHIPESLLSHLGMLFTQLETIELTLPSVTDEKVFEMPQQQIEKIDFEIDYPLTPLSLTEGDIISEIPPLPASI